MFSKDSDELDGQLKSFQSQLASLTKRVNLIEAASHANGGATETEPGELRDIKAAVERLDASLKSTMKTTIELMDSFKDIQSRNEETLGEFSKRIEKLETPGR